MTVLRVIASLSALPACSFIIDTNADGVIPKSDLGGKGSKEVGGASAKAGGVNQAGPSQEGGTGNGAGGVAGGGGQAGSPAAGEVLAGAGGAIDGTSSVGQSGLSNLAGGATQGGTSQGASGGGLAGSTGITTSGGVAGTGTAAENAGTSGLAGRGAMGGSVAGGSAGMNGTTVACVGPSKPCADGCVDVTSDKVNCGECGAICDSYQFCSGSKCLPTYVSTKVQPGKARVLSMQISKDKPQGDVLLELAADSEGITVTSPAAAIAQIVTNDVGIVKYAADGTFIWRRATKEIFGQYVNPTTVNAMALGPTGNLYIGYRYDEPANPGGVPRTPHLACIRANNNPTVLWDIKIPEGDVPVTMLARPASGDFITFGEPPDVVGKWTRSSICRFVDQETTAAFGCISASYATGAVVDSDGSTLWMWGRFDGDLPLSPWSTETWSITPNPSPGSNLYAWPDAYVIGARDSGDSTGAWTTEGDSGPELNLAVDSVGNLILTASSSAYATFNGGQALVGDVGSVLVKLEPATGQVVWRKPLDAVAARLLVGPSDRILILEKSAVGAPYVISIHSNSTGELLSRISTGVVGAEPVVSLGLTEMFVAGEVAASADFHPGTSTDMQGATPGVFVSRFAF